MAVVGLGGIHARSPSRRRGPTLRAGRREGLLESRARRGFRVPPLDRREVEETLRLIRVLEPLGLSTSLPSTAKQQRDLDRLRDRMERTGPHASIRHELDARWHRCLISGCPNERLKRFVEEARCVLRRYELAYPGGRDGMRRSVPEHRSIARAFASQRVERAVDLLTRLMAGGRLGDHRRPAGTGRTEPGS